MLDITLADGTEMEAELLAADDEKIRLKEVLKPEKKKKKAPSPMAAGPGPAGKRAGVKDAEEPKEFELKYADIKKAVIQISWK